MITIDFVLSSSAPANGFYLTHFDANSDPEIYFSSTATIGPSFVIPEPGSIVLLATAAALTILALHRRRTA
jgi:hypothetical protein